MPAAEMPAAARPAPTDDDPLTSPSFPRIAADDSRSYRRTRAEPPAAYPSVPRVESVSGLEAASQARSYPVPASYQMPAASAAGYAPANGGYAAPPEPANGASASSYQAPGSYLQATGAGQDGYSAAGGMSAVGHRPPEPAAPPGTGSYSSSDLPGYRAGTGSSDAYLDALQGGYSPGSSSLRYEGATDSYPLPAQTSGYDNGYPDQAAGYQGYADSGSSSGAHRRPEPGYQVGGYPGSAEPGFGGSLYGDLGYPAYPPPVPAEHGIPYQAPAAERPGYPDAPHNAGPYDPARYPASVHETGSYAGADPYAVDPYGQPDYGGSGY
jgi:hypothetical protein